MQDQPLAYQDREFLESDDARPLRILAEYLEPAPAAQGRQNIQDTVVFFGSARVGSRRCRAVARRLTNEERRRTPSTPRR